MLSNIDPTSCSSWAKLLAHYEQMQNKHIHELINEPGRFEDYHVQLEGFLLDYSKNQIDQQTLALLIELAEETGLKSGIESLFNGEVINQTENRSVMHMALRCPRNSQVQVEGQDIMPRVHRVLDQMETFTNKIAAKELLGYTNEPIKYIVNIGIGGSDLGPVMVTEALKPYELPHVTGHFVSNVDPSHLHQVLKHVTPEETLFIIASKTFTTQETMANAHAARSWFLQHTHESHIAKHFVAVSTNEKGVKDFGIKDENRFEFWDWVGGRYSVSSAIGLSIACLVGFDHFKSLLNGMHDMDEHFRSQPFHKNIPIILALLGIWYNNFFDYRSHAVLPYDQYFHRLPAYLQQLDMESNGKSIARNGQSVTYQTGPIIFGEAGTNGQHAFYQLIHQGTKVIPCDFIGVINSHNPINRQQNLLLSNLLAQSRALMKGRTEAELPDEMVGDINIKKFKTFSGSRPSNTILIKELNPFQLGRLISTYEHKVFTQGFIWNIFSFDQFGVELGKTLAKEVLPALEDARITTDFDASTNGLIRTIRNWRI